VRVLCGPSGCGKTAHVLDLYAAQVAQHGEDTALLILPGGRVVREARARLVESAANHGLGAGLVDPRIYTFPQLAELVLNANHECATAIRRTTQTLLLRDAIDRLAAGGHLGDLADSAGLPGFARALAELIADLKRAAVEPRDFCRALPDAGLTEPRHRGLAGLYCAYQWLLICLRYFDDEGLFWWARAVLGSGRRRPLERVRLMLVDGFADFTTTQLQMLRLLAAEVPETLIALDYSPEDDREGLAPWFQDTLQRLTAHLEGLVVEHLASSAGGGPLAHLRSRLFAPGHVPPADAKRTVHVLRCPSPTWEVREVLGRAKTLLATGRARPGDVAIVCRDPAERARDIESVAGRLGVPVTVDAPGSPLVSPAVGAVLLACETVVGDYRREDVLALLRAGSLHFQALTSREIDAAGVGLVAEKALVIEGREQWLTRVAALAERCQHVDDPKRAALGALAESVQAALQEVLDLLPQPGDAATLAQRVAEVRRFIAETDLWRRAADPRWAQAASSDLRALHLLDQTLDELEHAGPAASAGGGISPSVFLTLLTDVLAVMADTPPPPAGDRVAVLSARHARQLHFPVVFVIGLAEGDFPRRAREEPFFSAPELARLARAGVQLERRRAPEAYEPLLFHAAVSAAVDELWLTYPAADSEGRPIQPSHYLREARRLFAPETLDCVEVPFSQVMPLAPDVAEPRELLDRAVLDLASPGGGDLAYHALARLPGAPVVLSRLIEACRLDDLRESEAPAGPFVGELADPEVLADLAERFGPAHPFSPTDLGAYAACPFSFFCACVLDLTEPEYASADLDRRLLGNVRHRVLADLLRQHLEQSPGVPLIAPGQEDAARAVLERLIARRFAAMVERGEVPDEALWDLEQERCRRDLCAWAWSEAEAFGGQVPLRAEFAFGGEERPVALPGRPDIRFRGRLDRVNQTAEGYALIDYKLATVPGAKDVEAGRDVQFPIYSLGAEQELPELADSACAGWHYCGLRRPLSGVDIVGPAEIAALRGDLQGAISGLVDDLRAGRFSYTGVQACVRYCAFDRVCRHRPGRRSTGSEDTGDTDSA
jgi:ATP-dependent helicase/DNAse subunit B